MKKISIAILLVLLLGSVCVFAQATKEATAKAPVIALSNSYYGNSWRKQMVNDFEREAKIAKEAGRISDYIIVNGDGTQNTQIAQLNSLILQHPDAILINAASPTALNGVIQQAINQGIVVVTFDSIVTLDDAYKFDFNFVDNGAKVAEWAVKKFNGKANILQVRGVRGSAPEIDFWDGMMEVLSKYPGMVDVAEVDGNADDATSQAAVANILPSLGKIDLVITQGGAYGTAQAFEAAGRDVPPIVAANRSEFIHWWIDQKAKNGYDAYSISSEPSIGAVAFWLGLHIVEGDNVPKKISLPSNAVTFDTVDEYKDLEPGTVVSHILGEDFVVDLLKQY